MTADSRSKSSTDEETEGVFDVSKIKGKLAKRPPKGMGAAKKEKAAKDKKANDSKKSKKARPCNPVSTARLELARQGAADQALKLAEL